MLRYLTSFIVSLLMMISVARAQNPFIMTDAGMGSYGYLEKDATSNIFFRANSSSQSNIFQLFIRNFYNGSSNFLMYGNAVNTCGSTTNVVQQTFSYTLPALNNGSVLYSSVHADYCGGSNSYGGNPNQTGYNQRSFQVVDVFSDGNSMSSQLLPNPQMPNNVVLSFVINPGGVSGISFRRLWISTLGTAQESTDIPNDAFRLYYENYTGSETFTGTESFETLFGDYASNPTNNNLFGHDAMNSGAGITIPAAGLRCYVVLNKTNCGIGSKTLQVNVIADGISFSNSVDGFPMLKMDQTPSTGGTTLTVFPEVYLTATAGTATGNYCTVKSAFDAINAGTHRGNIAISLYGNTTETVTATLNYSGFGSASYSALSMQPAGGGVRTISGNLNAELINFNGASNVTLNGLNAGGNSLTISNTSNGSTANTIRFFARDASGCSNDVVTNCTILGSTTGATNGNVMFQSVAISATVGLSNITISNCTLDSTTGGTPRNGIYAVGTASLINTAINIQNNNIANFFISTASTSGIQLGVGNSGWTISGNKFYQSVPRNFTSTANRYSAISINQSSTDGTGFTISNNIIGYANSSSTGTTTITGSTNEFRGIYLSVGTAALSTIQGNTIASIAQTTGRVSTLLSNASFIAIQIDEGWVNVTNNTIGSQTATSITITASGTTVGLPPAMGIYNGGVVSTATTINSNTIGGISIPSSGGQVGFYGIRVYFSIGTATATISNNIIGGTNANSISLGNVNAYLTGISIDSAVSTISGNAIRNLTFTGSPSALYGVTGIEIFGGAGANFISGNRISNLSATSSTSAFTQVFGILQGGGVGTYNYSNDTINDLTTNSPGTHDVRLNTQTADAYSSVTGICIAPAFGSPGAIAVSSNLIYRLFATNTGTTAYPSVIGIETTTASTTANNTVTGNVIYGLENRSTKTSLPLASIIGIRSCNGRWSYQNNMVTLTNGSNTNNCWVFGLSEGAGATSAATSKWNFNSVYIGGTVATGTAFTAALNIYAAGLSVDSFRNNIFMNYRANSGGTGRHYSIAVYPSFTPSYVGAYNVLYSNTTTTTCRTGAGTDVNFAGWLALGANYDQVSSLNNAISFMDPTTGNLHLTVSDHCVVDQKGVTVSGITTDIDGDTRQSPPDIGADELTYQNIYSVPSGSGNCASASTVTTSSCGNLSGTSWYYFINNNTKRVVAAINPNNSNLGAVTLSMFNLDSTFSSLQSYTDHSGFNWNYLNKVWNMYISGSVTPGAEPIIRFYYTPSEMLRFRQASGLGGCGAQGGSCSDSDLVLMQPIGVTGNCSAADNGTASAYNFYWYKNPSNTAAEIMHILRFGLDLSTPIYNGALNYFGNISGAVGAVQNWSNGEFDGRYFQARVSTISNLSSAPSEFRLFLPPSRVLPVEWSQVQARLVDQQAGLVQWSTITEKQTQRFEVERSTDGRNFYTIGEVQAAGMSNDTRSYQFRDNNLTPGKTYYRIKVIAAQNQISYSAIVSVTLQAKQPLISITPNPVRNQMRTELFVPVPVRATLQLVSVSGHLVETRSVQLAAGSNVINWNTNPLPAGMYYLRLMADNIEVVAKPFVKL